MSFFRPFLTVLVLASQAWAKTSVIDVTCEMPLSPALFQSFVEESMHRKNLDGVATYLDGDDAKKLIDVRGADAGKTASAIIKNLGFDKDAQQNPHLSQVIAAAQKAATDHKALLSVSSWVMPDGMRTIRLSLDLVPESGAVTLIRLPSLDIRNGSLSKRIDIDVSPVRLTLLSGNSQAVTGFGKVVVSEPASHSRGLEIFGSDPSHPVIDAFMAPLENFVGGTSYPQLTELLDVATEITRAIHPGAKDISFRTSDEVHALNQGHGWSVPN